MRSHSEDKLFTCGLCDFKSNWKRSLQVQFCNKDMVSNDEAYCIGQSEKFWCKPKKSLSFYLSAKLQNWSKSVQGFILSLIRIGDTCSSRVMHVLLWWSMYRHYSDTDDMCSYFINKTSPIYSNFGVITVRG